uniref:Putative zn2+-dependent endopeptidase insulinase superfamily protein n=1 Tax=Nyssomyia neivai TaxID=330878 RepID=A0A1L8DTH1_9DIPT
MSSFKLICSTKANGKIPVHKYRSESTGLTLILAEVEGPVVNGYFALATEVHDDDGLPHTLEHLIFLGSELYPYKGVLDLLANRCLASGTNAWTDTDHTCYTMTTAGSDGFLELLPIYLDHILYPTLSDAGFITEVHHISGDGEDGGVVYCEMQGRENSGESKGQLQMLRSIYPNCGYSAETGGIMHNLRTSTTNKKVKDYHAAFYRPENLSIIVTGQVTIDELLRALKPVEERIVKKSQQLPIPFQRPWQTPVAPLSKCEDIKVLYPSDEEDCGLVFIAYRGPKCTVEHTTLTACAVLMRYLSDTSVSPLQRDLLEIDDPYASKVSYNIGENSETVLNFTYQNVPLSLVDDVYKKHRDVLKKIACGEEKIDMIRMGNIIEKNILESWSCLEDNPHEAIAFLVIGDVLYGSTQEDFELRLNTNIEYESFKGKDETFWIDLLKKYFVDTKTVLVRAVPSIEEQQRMSKEEIERIERQRADLGVEGMNVKGDELSEAMAYNEIPPPTDMLTQVPIPGTEGIKFHPVQVYRSSEKAANPTGLDVDNLPVYAEAYDMHTNFVYMIVTLNTDSLKPDLRPYLLLFIDLLMESPIRRDGVLIPYEQVVAALESDVISSSIALGLESKSRFSCGPFSHTLTMTLQVEPQKYTRGIKWIKELLHDTEITVERIRVCVAKMINDVAQAKRKGNSVVHDLLKALFYNRESNVQLSSMLRQHKFLTALLERMDTSEGAAGVVDDLNWVRYEVTRAKNIAIHVAADWMRLGEIVPDLNAPWKEIARIGDNVDSRKLSVVTDWQLMNVDASLPDGTVGTIVGLGCVEGAYFIQASPAIRDFMDPDLPALLLFLQYLTQLEGPLWRQIRGQGLAYGYSMIPRPHEGLLYLTFYRSTNVMAAYKETKIIVERQIYGNDVENDATSRWDATLLESARSSLIFELIDREKSLGDIVSQCLLSSFKNISIDYNRIIIEKIGCITEEDLSRVGKKYVEPLFSNKSKIAIVCHPDRSSDIAAAFEQMGYHLSVKVLEDSVLAHSC